MSDDPARHRDAPQTAAEFAAPDATGCPRTGRGAGGRTTAGDTPAPDSAPDAPRADLPDAARRALAEAEARRRATPPADLPPELGGRDGPEPVRFGDYERRGIAVDF